MSSDPSRIPPGPIGFRLANELEGLLLGIASDRRITPDETARLQRWLTTNEPYAWIAPFDELAAHLTHVLADGQLTEDECEDLLFVTRRFTRVNPHFDQLRGGLQILNGLLAGVAADGELTEAEAITIGEWAQEWAHLGGLWPYEEVNAIVGAMIAHRRIDSYRAHLLDLARQFPVAGEQRVGDGAPPPLLVRGVCAMDPQIVFTGKRFVVTGDSARCDRHAIEEKITALGGVPWPRVTKAIDYLVVCDGGSPHWAFACYGRKVEQAYDLRRAGHTVMLVHELDFWDAVAGWRVTDTGAGV